MKKLSLILIFAIAGCSTASKLPCETTDWYEIGRQKGATGTGKALPSELASSCRSEESKLDAQALFESGHSLGLTEYCSEKNGYQLGQMDQNYKMGTCPQLLEENFLKGYRSGQEAVQISRERKNIKNKIQRIEGQLRQDNLHFSKKALLKAERIELQKTDGDLMKKHSAFKNQYEAVNIDESFDPSFFVQ